MSTLMFGMPPRRTPSLMATTLLLLTSSFLSFPLPCHSIFLDIHVPLPQGCLKYHALLANRLLRGASRPPPPARSENGEEEEDALTRPSEEVNLFSDHTPHVTLYLADFDLEADDEDDDAQEPSSGGSADNAVSTKAGALNQTKVDAFLDAISSLNLTGIIDGWECPLSLSEDPSTSVYYTVNGAYTMLPIKVTPCLQTLSTTLLRSLQSHLRYPIAVPIWVGELPEPARSAAIYRSREYGSPNVLEGFEPHVTVGFDPSGSKSDSSPGTDGGEFAAREGGLSVANQAGLQWRDDSMKQWNDAFVQVRETCVDEVQGIALGKTGVGGTVLANSRMGYWHLTHETKSDDGTHAAYDQNAYVAAVE
mmetsp:Transcript_38298/g.92378  ORF Transcript_38298/g.92378 Transcript_38298/m.92378 type:complete len:364 (+) Transcript_38298:112-1203(+)